MRTLYLAMKSYTALSLSELCFHYHDWHTRIVLAIERSEWYFSLHEGIIS